ncbi:ATP-binding cassette domain-containing protein, partial [Halomonas sp. G11]|uniref:ATP-binding cassette domain-containing protein n=1 Tax=Halomonas sp. G11 TaxID=1684425 RepID=UPI000AF043DB
ALSLRKILLLNTLVFRGDYRVTSQGVSVLYISHRLNEVREICQRATILRNGATMGTVDLEGVDDEDIFSMMVGHESSHKNNVARENATNGEVLLETDRLASKMLKGINLKLHAGEILGVAGLEGQGQQELFRIFGGLHKPKSGEIRVGGKITSLNTPRQALRINPGIAFVPEERKTEGIFPSLSAAANISIPNFATTGWAKIVNGRLEHHLAAEAASQVSLSTRYLDFEVGNLSGGNQQKVLLARALMTGAKILVLFDPTRGVDVGTKQSIYAMMRHFVDQGGAIIFYSSELSELVQLSSRCLVVYDGLITDDVAANEISEERLLASAHGPVIARKDSIQEAV